MTNDFIDIKIIRKLQKYTVSLYEKDFNVALENRYIYELNPDSKIYVCNDLYYNLDVGYKNPKQEGKRISV